MPDHSGGSLSLGAEWDAEDDVDVVSSFLELLFDVIVCRYEVVDEATLGHIADRLLRSVFFLLDSGSTVKDNTFSNELTDRRVLQRRIFLACNDVVLEVGLHHCHLVLGQGTGLISADFLSISHGLRGVKLLDKVVLFGHSADREGKRNGDSKWQALWDSNDNHSESNDECIQHVDQVLVVVEGSGVGQEDLAQEADHHSDEGQDGAVKASLSNLLSNGLQLELKRGHILLDVHGQTSAAYERVDTDSHHDGGTGASLDECGLEQEGVGVVSVGLSGAGFLSDGLRFSSEVGLVGGEVVGCDDDAVGRHGVTSWDLDDVSYDELRGIDGALGPIAVYPSGHNVTLGLELLKLLLLDIVVGDSNHDDDADGDDDGGTIDPAMGPAVLVDADCHGGNGSHAQDSHDGIVEALDDHITDGPDGSLQRNILSVSINSRVKIRN